MRDFPHPYVGLLVHLANAHGLLLLLLLLLLVCGVIAYHVMSHMHEVYLGVDRG